MTKQEFVARMDKQVAAYRTNVRKERASLLVWFLINYFRLDEDTAVDLVCDSDNDKGIDGIYVDEANEEIYLFQSKYSPNPGSDQGDNDLRNFIGARSWFEKADNINHLDASHASQELKSLVTRLEVFERISRNYKVYVVFVTNKIFDYNAKDYLKVLGDQIEAWDLNQLFNQYTYTGRDQPVLNTFDFTLDTNNCIEYKTAAGVEVIIFPAKTVELVGLSGIQDRTLFARNVRYGLGRTRVNKDIAKTLEKVEEHENFFLYHNGITLVCEHFELEEGKLSVTNYSVVNGCQSTLSFYENKQILVEKIKTLLRVIKIGTDDRLSSNITYYTNNQNSISLKDLKSNDKIQQDLQDEFFKLFNREILYKIKSGEDVSNYKTVIDNDFAAQLLTSFTLKEPHAAHQKTRIFTDNYNAVFNRYVNASQIFLLAEIYRAVDSNSHLIDDEGIRTYKLTRFFFVYVFRQLFENDPIGKTLIADPASFLKTYPNKYFGAFETLFKLLVLDFNNYVSDQKQAGYFDYKNVLRNSPKVSAMANEILTAYKKLLVHHPEDAFSRMVV